MPEPMEKKKIAPVVPKPYAPENRFLSKTEYVARQRVQKEHDAKVKAYSEEIKTGREETPAEEEPKKKTKK